MSELPDSLQELEVMIAAAGDYIQPSDQLRPRVLEVACTRQQQMSRARHMFQAAALIFVCVLATLSVQERLDDWRRSAFSPGTEEMQQRARAYANQPMIGHNWGLYEAFQDLRQDQMLKIPNVGQSALNQN